MVELDEKEERILESSTFGAGQCLPRFFGDPLFAPPIGTESYSRYITFERQYFILWFNHY
jgi:hypothetical protein